MIRTEAEHAAVRPSLLLDTDRHARLVAWVERRYRESLAPQDLADPALLRESREALDERTAWLGLGSGYHEFQRGYGAGLQIVDIPRPSNRSPR